MLEQAERERALLVCETLSTKKTSPWLQLIRWVSYLDWESHAYYLALYLLE